MEKVVGIREFGGKVDITDPCYDRDVWCRMNDVEITPGAYECFVDVWDSEQTGGWGNRVARLGIRRVGSDVTVFERIGEIGVDAGMAGIFENKPDYDGEAWDKFCDGLWSTKNEMYWLWDAGFFSNSGYGDGGYDVFAAKDQSGSIVALEIHFIVEDDEEEWDDELEDEETEDNEE